MIKGSGKVTVQPGSAHSEKARVQQVAKVSLTEQAAFHTYAEQFGLHVSTIASLLLARELRLKRLGELCENHPPEKGILLNGKIVVYLHSDILKKAFKSHATDAQMRPGPAAATVFRAELAERWLERVIGMC
jgi:hypothetical protein